MTNKRITPQEQRRLSLQEQREEFALVHRLRNTPPDHLLPRLQKYQKARVFIRDNVILDEDRPVLDA